MKIFSFKRRAAPPSCPTSDVSAVVGIVGLAGLALWVMICRNWPAIADLWDLPGPRLRMDGQNAAVMALLWSGLPMIAWSIGVNKVHRRASTGLDWTKRKRLSETLRASMTKLIGLWATWAMMAFIYGIARWYWQGSWLFAMHLLGVIAVPMFILSVPYVLWLDRYGVNQRDAAWHFGTLLIGREACDMGEVRRHLRMWLVKGFFTAFMFSILPGGFAMVVDFNPGQALNDPVALTNALTGGLFMVDVQIGTVGYLMTLKPLDAHIRSANPLLAGWLAALMCYPPFVLMGGGGPLDYHPYTADWSHWLAPWPMFEWVWGGWLVLLTAIYASATVAFGLRFSNLTWRGVLTNGPYRFSRHPAYLAKNLFWWSGAMPFMVTTNSMVDSVRNISVMALVSGVYYWRAKTEEKHLLAEDPKYRAYWLWMEQHGLITSGIGSVWRWLKGPDTVAVGKAHPAE